MKPAAALLLAVISALLSSCTSLPLKTVEHVDLDRFMGAWYVVGTIPWVVEKNNVGTMDIYEPRKDGKIDIRYVFHKKSLDAPRQEWKAVGHVVNTKSNAEWAVQFIWPFQAPYLVIDLSPDYQQTVIGHPSRKLVWIMSRQPTIPESDYARTLTKLAGMGFDPKSIVRVPQRAPSSK